MNIVLEVAVLFPGNFWMYSRENDLNVRIWQETLYEDTARYEYL